MREYFKPNYTGEFNYTEFDIIRNFLSESNSPPFIQQNK